MTRIQNIKEIIDKYFENRYETKWILSQKSFIKKDGTVFRVTWVEGLSGFVVEYADNEYAALRNAFDDGDVFEANDEKIIEKMEKEIEED